MAILNHRTILNDNLTSDALKDAAVTLEEFNAGIRPKTKILLKVRAFRNNPGD